MKYFYRTRPRDWPTFWMWLVEQHRSEWVVPGDQIAMRLNDQGTKMCLQFSEDGGMFWIGYPDKWLTHLRARNAVRMALWILCRYWIVGTWCGLRRWVYFRALHVHVASFHPRPLGEGGERSVPASAPTEHMETDTSSVPSQSQTAVERKGE